MEMIAGTTYRLRLINITPASAGLVFRLARDGFPMGWVPLAHDGWTLPVHQRDKISARQPVSVGETYDFTFTPERPGELALELWLPGPSLAVRQPIRVVAPEMTRDG